MKRVFVLLLCLCLVLASFSGCNTAKVTDVWDGSIADSFASGNGSKKAPFIIEKASQLAFLASEINEGKDYKDKYFSLTSDLDLNNIEWMPIGNGNNSFNGIFDGRGHTISNLSISKGVQFITDTAVGQTPQYAAGLFGSCTDSVIKNLAIDKANILIQNVTDRQTIMAGVLVGTLRSSAASEISNITITNAKITCDFELETAAASLRIGGVFGYVYGDASSSCSISNINSVVDASVKDGHGAYNLIGGIAGAISANNLCDIRNSSSYLSIFVDVENCYMQHNYFGAFGSITARDNIISISNIFSKVTINKVHNVFHGYSAYRANAIIGETYHGKQADGSVKGGFEFKNLFGYVEQIDEISKEVSKVTRLYEMPDHAIFTEENCQGCEALPKNHKFDKSIWNLTDLSAPKVQNK